MIITNDIHGDAPEEESPVTVVNSKEKAGYELVERSRPAPAPVTCHQLIGGSSPMKRVEDTNAVGLRAVATLEAVKGGMILLIGLGLLGLLHKDVESVADNLLIHLHVNPETRLSRALLNAAERMTDARLWSIAIGAVTYSAVRFIESWGLWNRRVWAQWFAILSGSMYLPWEITKVLERPNMVHAALLLCNLAIVLYMTLVRALANGARVTPVAVSLPQPWLLRRDVRSTAAARGRGPARSRANSTIRTPQSSLRL
jgi:uncharacterized membrane protein (DUF2068 family)